jgi:hypothetical protein
MEEGWNSMRVLITEKKEDGQLEAIDRRDWTQDMLAALQHANYILLNGQEYEMLEGRLDVNEAMMEILVMPVGANGSEPQ